MTHVAPATPELTNAGRESFRAKLEQRGLPADDAAVDAGILWFGRAFTPRQDVKDPHPVNLRYPLVWDTSAARTGERLFRMVQGKAVARFPIAERFGDVEHPANETPFYWSRPLTKEERGHKVVLAWDINGQFLNVTSSLALGDDRPDHYERPRIIGKQDAYYRLEIDHKAAAKRTLPPLAHKGDGWYSAPVARHLQADGLVIRMHEAWVWKDSHEWLSRWNTSLRLARTLLMTYPEHAECVAALAGLKGVYTDFVGWLGSTKYNSTDLFRPNWRHAVQSESRSRMYRTLQAVENVSGRTPFLINVDAVYFTAESEDFIPDGGQRKNGAPVFEVSKQLGKWKPVIKAMLAPGLLSAIDGTVPRKLVEKIKEHAL